MKKIGLVSILAAIPLAILLGSRSGQTVMVAFRSFNAGQVSSYLESRTDYPKYQSALRTAENVFVSPLGPVYRRPGTYYIAEANEATSRLLKFEYNTDDAYVIEAGDQYFRFYRNGGQILDGASAYELDTDFDEDEIWDIRYAQSDNLMYIVDGNDVPQVLTRADHDDWSIADHEYVKGPFLPENSPSTYGPDLCTDTGQLSVVATTGGDADYLIDNSLEHDSYWHVNHVRPTWLWKYDFGVGKATIEQYTMSSGDDNEESMPKSWVFQGSDNDADWTDLDTRTLETNWTTFEKRTYNFINETAYRYYRIYASEGNNGNIFYVYETEMMADDDEAINISADAVSGDITLTASSALFDEDHVGALWKLVHEKGGDIETTGIVEITAYTSSTSVDATTITPLGSTDATERWSEGAWSDYRGWPKTVAFHQQRLVYGGSESYPTLLWFSSTGDYNDFEAGTDDDDAFSVALQGQNPIQWLISQNYLLIGTTGGVGRYGSEGAAVTPTTPAYQEQTPHGSDEIHAVMTTDTAVYVERGGRNIREFSYNLQYDRYIAPDLTILSQEITESGVVDMCFQARPIPMVWCVLDDGEMATLTYQRDQQVIGWTKQITDGEFTSVVSIPDTDSDEDEVWVIVKRTIDSNDTYYVEQFQPQEWGSDANDCFFVDSGLSYSGSSTDTFEGLDHLVGESVEVYGDADWQAAEDVNSGGGVIITTAVSECTIGLPFTSKIETLPISIDAREPSLDAADKRINRVYFDLYKTHYFKYGGSSSATLTVSDFDENITSTYTFKRMNFPYSSFKKPTIYIETDKPVPLCIRAMLPEISFYLP